MAPLFYILGGIASLLGLGILAFNLQTMPLGSLAAGFGIWVSGTPIALAVGLISSGLVCLAIGGVLSRLDRLIATAERAPPKQRADFD